MTRLARWLALLAPAAGCASVATTPVAPNQQGFYRERYRSDGLPFEQIQVLAGLRTFDDDGFDPHEREGLIALDVAEGMGLGNLWLEGGIHIHQRAQFDRDVADHHRA